MFTVKKIPKTPNILWDAAARKPLCRFVKGKLETNDEALADKLKGMGYEVTGEADAPEGAEPPAENPDKKEEQPEGAEPETPKTSTGGRKRATK